MIGRRKENSEGGIAEKWRYAGSENEREGESEGEGKK